MPPENPPPESTILEPPLGGYLTLLSIFFTAGVSFVSWFRRSGRPLPERIEARDLALLTVASHKLARVISRDRVMRPLRYPFTVLQDNAGPGEVSECPRATRGLRHAIGDLLVCPFCLGMWTSALFVAALAVAPRFTRWIASILAAYFGTELLQVFYKRAEKLL